MKKILPEISLEKHSNHNIGVMNFEQLFSLLNQATDHDPFAPHIIKFYMILIVTKNTYKHFIDFKSYHLSEGSLLFVTKNQVHHFNKELKEASGFCIVFSHFFVDSHYFLTDNLRLNRLFNYHIECPSIHQKEIGDNNLIEIIADIHREYHSSNNFAKSEILASLLRVLLLKAERAKEFQAVVNISTHWLEVFSEFRIILEKEYVNTRSARYYASRLYVSYKFLNDIVKKLTGKTVKVFINDFVTVEIKRYLISTSLSVNEISYKVGFEEPANMIKFFKKNMHTTPLKFRQQL